MSTVGSTTALMISALNNLPNSFAAKILKDIIVDSPKHVTGVSTNAYDVTGTFTNGLRINADGTTAINITSTFTGTTGILLAGTATNGISITGACTTAFDVTGTVTTGISLAMDGTTGIEITSAFSGTTGLLVAGTATNGISITGACATASLNIAHTLAAADDQAILMTTSSTATSGSDSQAPIKMNHTMTGVGSVGGRAEFNTTYNGAGAIGGWSNALKGNFTFGASATGGTGLHSAVCAEITVPDASVSGGFYTCFEGELNLPSSHVPQANQLSFMYLKANTTAATMDTYGALFSLQGLTSGDNKMWDETVSLTNPQIEAMLRIDVGGTFWYIPVCDQPDAD